MFLRSLTLRNLMATNILGSATNPSVSRFLPHVQDKKFLFFNTDWCPMGQKGWMTLLEKQVDFKYVEVNSFDKDSEITKLFLEVSPKGLVPAGVHYGKNIHEPIPFCYYIDEMFPETCLWPTSPYQRWKALYLLGEISEEFVPKLYRILCEQNPAKMDQHKTDFEEVLRFFDKQLEEHGCSWLMGEQFTLVDISLLTFAERMQALLPHYTQWDPVQKHQNLKRWMENGFQRESFKITSAVRSEQSMRVHPFKALNRVEYLIETFDAARRNKTEMLKRLLKGSAIPFAKDFQKEIRAISDNILIGKEVPTTLGAV